MGRLVLFGVALAALLIAWAFADPPGTGPDEPAHYVRALGAGGGHFAGERFRPTAAERRSFVLDAGRKKALGGQSDGAGGTKRVHWLSRVMRRYPVPRELSDVTFTGKGPRGDTQTSQTGTYQPYSLVAAGVAMRAADDAAPALRIGRLVQALIALILLVAAAAVLYDARAPGLSLAGLLVAITPMVLFTGAIVSPSGPEIAAGICFGAAGLRILRDPAGGAPAWTALALSGAVLSCARTLGPAFLAMIVVALIGLSGRSAAAAAVRADRRRAAIAVAVVAAGILAGLAWEIAYMPHPSTTPASLARELSPSITRLPGLLREVVGIFGGLDSKLPLGAFLAWLALGAALFGAAFRVASPRERRTILALVAAAPVVCVALSMSQLQTGFGLQGRHVLAILALVPLVCGEVVLRNRERLSNRLATGLAVGLPAGAGVVQGVAWLANAHHYAGGSWLLTGSSWEPPQGWWPWLALAAAGSAGYLALAALEARRAAAA